MTVYYLPFKAKNKKANAIKAVSDIDSSLESMGLTKICGDINIDPTKHFAFFFYRRKVLSSIKKALKGKKDTLIVIQYPTYLGNSFLFPFMMKRVLKKQRPIYIIHDLNGIRFKNSYVSFIDRSLLSDAYRVISHNLRMSEYLVKEYKIDPDKIVNLNLFDYLLDKPNDEKRSKSSGVDFAGNLNKTYPLIREYINSKAEEKLNLYGYFSSDKSLINSEYVSYKGVFPPDKIPYCLHGGFGLVWDGDSLDGCYGKYGEYTKYNNPHKASLYIASGLPIIVSSSSALSVFVFDYGVGFSVSSILDIPSVISNMTEAEYQKMVDNVHSLSSKLIKGEMIKDAINKALKEESK